MGRGREGRDRQTDRQTDRLRRKKINFCVKSTHTDGYIFRGSPPDMFKREEPEWNSWRNNELSQIPTPRTCTMAKHALDYHTSMPVWPALHATNCIQCQTHSKFCNESKQTICV